MAIVNDLVEDWIEIRSKLQRQLKMLESGETAISDATTQATIARVKSWIGDLNALLKEYARADRN